jgi:hypothetical protein
MIFKDGDIITDDYYHDSFIFTESVWGVTCRIVGSRMHKIGETIWRNNNEFSST